MTQNSCKEGPTGTHLLTGNQAMGKAKRHRDTVGTLCPRTPPAFPHCSLGILCPGHTEPISPSFPRHTRRPHFPGFAHVIFLQSPIIGSVKPIISSHFHAGVFTSEYFVNLLLSYTLFKSCLKKPHQPICLCTILAQHLEYSSHSSKSFQRVTGQKVNHTGRCRENVASLCVKRSILSGLLNEKCGQETPRI